MFYAYKSKRNVL